ncbi:MAG: exodeoxyribonuclease VII large subunit, partial [Limnochordia bacterium]
MTELAFEPQVWTVSGVTRLIQNTLAAEPLLQSIMVRGEISNYKKYPSGHSYFTLKDDSASLRCVLFRGHSHNVPFEPANGQEVMAMGRVGVYPASGQYQLYVEYMLPQGEGALHYAFTQLKEKLAAEGLFQRKRPLPSMPSRVGIITSRQGAVLRDIISVARRRNPRVDLVLCPAVVQGPEAPASLIEALELCNRYGELDVLIIGRGGGSLEELWAFNDEGVARAIFDSRIPVVSAVGHETDVTIADYVADLRAPTPSAAAELVIPDYEQWKGQLQAYQERLTNYMVRRISEARQAVAALGDRPVL